MPADAWGVLEVANWQAGVLEEPDTKYRLYSVEVASRPPSEARSECVRAEPAIAPTPDHLEGLLRAAPAAPLPVHRVREAELERWYKERVDALGPGARSSEHDDWEAAKRELSEGITRDAIRKIRSKASPGRVAPPGSAAEKTRGKVAPRDFARYPREYGDILQF